MSRLAHSPRTARAQRGTVTRGLLVLGVLVGAVMLQTSSPAWQSRLDAVAASLGMPSGACRTPAVTASHRPAATPATATAAVAGPVVARPSHAGPAALPAPASLPRGVAALPAHAGAVGASMASGVAAVDAPRGGNRSGGAGFAAPAGLSAPAI